MSVLLICSLEDRCFFIMRKVALEFLLMYQITFKMLLYKVCILILEKRLELKDIRGKEPGTEFRIGGCFVIENT